MLALSSIQIELSAINCAYTEKNFCFSAPWEFSALFFSIFTTLFFILKLTSLIVCEVHEISCSHQKSAKINQRGITGKTQTISHWIFTACVTNFVRGMSLYEWKLRFMCVCKKDFSSLSLARSCVWWQRKNFFSSFFFFFFYFLRLTFSSSSTTLHLNYGRQKSFLCSHLQSTISIF